MLAIATEALDTITDASLRSQIEDLTRANRERRDSEAERRLVHLRHHAGQRLLDRAAGSQAPPAAAAAPVPAPDGVPEVGAEDLTPELVRTAILQSGCLLVRGLFDREAALRFEDGIERAFGARDRAERDGSDGYYRPFEPDSGPLLERGFVTDAGGIWAGDSPRLMFEMLELFERRGLRELIHEYLGGDAAFSLQKCTLRKVAPTAGNGFPGWHQDGRFLGDVRALNVWVTLTHCGDEAPGLYLVPRRIDQILETGTEGAVFDWVVSPDVVDAARGETRIVKPIFEPGDAMLFDDLFLHSTAADPAMPNHRYAIESWFFSPSGFPTQYAPLAL